MFDSILLSFGLNPSEFTVKPFGSGLINHTLKVSGNAGDYILQQINVNVFKTPQHIAKNLSLLQQYFHKNHPGYLFVGPLHAVTGEFLVRSKTGEVFRLFPFIKGSQTINFVSTEKQAYEAAKQFGRFTRLLKDFEIDKLEYTLSDFHNLKLRFEQFKTASQNAETKKLDQASAEIHQVYQSLHIVQTYTHLIANKEVPLRAIHHDTKISNVLFDDDQNGLCVIDLDTVMPGYYLSDVGDMMRTYLSASNEEETDLSKIQIREDIFSAICKGYLSEMGGTLTGTEKKYFIFSGQLMIYMQALRFLTDFLNNDVYYETNYPDHNLNRARNQLKLLNAYEMAEPRLEQLMVEAQKDNAPVFK